VQSRCIAGLCRRYRRRDAVTYPVLQKTRTATFTPDDRRDETKDMRQDEASENGVPAWGKSRELADFAKFRGGVGEWTRLLQPTDRVIDLLLPSTT
jgi:hypothetical protein